MMLLRIRFWHKLSLLMVVLVMFASLLSLPEPALAANGPNLIANPSVETASSNNSSLPQSWLQGGWGTNSRSYTYLNTGNSGARSVKVQISSYSSGDAKWYFAPVAVTANTTYQYSDYYQSNVTSRVVAQLDDGAGNYSYTELANAAASSSWKSYSASIKTSSNTKNITIFHLISSVGWLTIDDANLNLPTTVIAPSISVSLANPTNGANVSGSVPITTTVSSTNPVSDVQFYVDSSLVSSVSSSPYTYTWNTANFANGTHIIYAKATDNVGTTSTSSSISVTVNNSASSGGGGSSTSSSNLIPNPSVETSDPADTSSPQNWYKGSWGSNTTVFSYSSTAHTGSKSVRIDMSKFSNGGANWTYAAPQVSAGKQYTFSNYYQSNISTQVLVAVKLSSGSTQYMWLGSPVSSSGVWTKFSATFTMPSNAVSAVAYQELNANGYLMVDDSSLTEVPQSQTGFNAPLVTITFDDGMASQYNNALPVLESNGFKATFYIISGYLGICDANISSICYMTNTQVQSISSLGHEIGSHTVDHPDLTTLNATQIDNELSQSQVVLAQLVGKPVTSFASPYGRVNNGSLTEIAKFYTTHRGVLPGYNDRSNFDKNNLLVQNVNSDTTVAQVKSYIDFAKSSNSWLILVYHDINTNPNLDPGYNTYPADFAAEMAYLKASGIQTATINQAIALLSN